MKGGRGMDVGAREVQSRPGGVVVITSALRAEGPRFEPGPSHKRSLFHPPPHHLWAGGAEHI